MGVRTVTSASGERSPCEPPDVSPAHLGVCAIHPAALSRRGSDNCVNTPNNDGSQV